MRECQTCKNCFADTVATCPNDGMPTVHTIPGDGVLEGKYHLEYRLGQGGMGVVYKARHAYLKTLHAIKIILPDLVGNDPQLVTRFRQEALAAAAIRHQNVVSVSDYGVINGNVPFLVMEYVEGESLHDLLAREGRLSPESALDLISAICAGVGAAHHQGIVHRDLKPLNVMICSDRPSMSQAVKILDFGLAKIKSGELLGSFIQAQTTGLMGSPYYMAPEQWADEDPDSRADIYSLGVMLFQMLAGDVPFKGSSIPAIMKKHISDPPPTFASLGIAIAPEIERAVFHTLEKTPSLRTASVEIMVDEFRRAIDVTSNIHTTTGAGALPVSTIRVHTRPAGSKVFVDNVSVGESQIDGSLLLEGIQSGNHFLRISHNGFDDWVDNVVCDGKPVDIVAELRHSQPDINAIPRPDTQGLPGATLISERPLSMPPTPGVQTASGAVQAPVVTMPPVKKSRTGLFLGIGALLVLFVLGIAGVAGAYLLGFFPGSKPIANASPSPSVVASPHTTPTELPDIKADLVSIPAGTFRMGRNDGQPQERPEHEVSVEAFKMDRTEVTNAEYYEFVAATGHKPLPADWVNGRPLEGKENFPVRFVNMDDVLAFAGWRSKRDNVQYRLPTDAEWEYAARNGSDSDLYPWGDGFRPECAWVDQSNTEPTAVGKHSCPDKWGVSDLIGNVYEWTSSKAYLYPGSGGAVKESKEPRYMIRGGSAFSKSSGDAAITSTSRPDVPASTRDKELGFRLVTK
ncbi:MAG: SUMF1/EgtB/PvdO family nonheme iron enzyme [Acidobacteria bacterium]|nr:SUMF1/EgtB/PvdO family nonheme iron enzyme [Acidobacteriota bacterium]